MIIGDGVILGGGGEAATIVVTAPAGSTVTMQKPDGGTAVLPSQWRENPEWRGLPAGYTQVEYLESIGAQKIDTGYIVKANTKMVDVSAFTTLAGQYSGNYIGGAFFMYGIGSYPIFEFWVGNTHVEAGTADTDKHTFTVDAEHKKAYLDTTEYDLSSTAFTQDPNTLTLFSMRSSATSWSNWAYMKTYSVKLYESGNIVHDYVPCVNSNQIAGLYDMVTGSFLTNSGSGSFTVGNAVPEYFEVYAGKANKYGTYTVIATKDVQTATKEILVDAATEYAVEMIYVAPADGIMYNNAIKYVDGDATYNTIYNRFQLSNAALARSVVFAPATVSITFTDANCAVSIGGVPTYVTMYIDSTSIGRVQWSGGAYTTYTYNVPAEYIDGQPHDITISHDSRLSIRFVGAYFNV